MDINLQLKGCSMHGGRAFALFTSQVKRVHVTGEELFTSKACKLLHELTLKLELHPTMETQPWNKCVHLTAHVLVT